MARERIFTDEQVAVAAAELQKEGKPVNGTSLRNKIGVGRPSALISIYEDLCKNGTVTVPVTIEKQEDTSRHYDLDPVVASMRDVMFGDLDVMIQNINNAANANAENKLRAALVEATELKVSAEQQVADAQEQETNAYNESEDLRDVIESLEESLKDQIKLTAELRDQLSDVHHDLEISKNQTEEVVTDRDARIKDLNDKFDRAISEKDVALSAKSEAIGEVRALTKQTQSLELSLETEKSKSEKLMIDCASMTAKVEIQTESLVTVNAHVSQLTKKLAASDAMVGKLKHEILQNKKATIKQVKTKPSNKGEVK